MRGGLLGIPPFLAKKGRSRENKQRNANQVDRVTRFGACVFVIKLRSFPVTLPVQMSPLSSISVPVTCKTVLIVVGFQ